jgi:hypothetical protein
VQGAWSAISRVLTVKWHAGDHSNVTRFTGWETF